MEILAIIALGSALVGAAVSAFGAHQANKLFEKALNEYGELNPDTFREIVTEELGPSAFEQIQRDASLREAQVNALERLREIEEGGGFDVRDRANLNRVMGEAARADQANRSQILEGFQQRGVSGSGAEYVAQLQSAQQAANRQHQGALDVAADARRRYFDAIRERAGLAGDIRSQDWREESDIARAKDHIDQLNWGRRREDQVYNNEGRQRDFQNQLSIADRKSGIYTTQAGATRDSYDKAGAAIANAGQGLGEYAAEGGKFPWDKDKK